MSINRERQLRVEWLHTIQRHRQIGLVNAKETFGPGRLGTGVSVGGAQTEPWGLSHSALAARAGASDLSCERPSPALAPTALDSGRSLERGPNLLHRKSLPPLPGRLREEPQ